MKNIIINIIFFLLVLLFYKIINKNLKEKITIKNIIFYLITLIITSIVSHLVTNEYNNYYLISLFTNITALTFLNLILKKEKRNMDIDLKNIVLTILFGISLSYILELTIFNYRHYESLTYEESTLTNIVYDEKIITKDDYFYVKENGEYTIEIIDINKKINNIYLKLTTEGNKYKCFEINLFATDEANSVYYELPSIRTIENVPRSFYHHFNLSGKSEKIAIKTSLSDTFNYSLEEVKINTVVPIFISIGRIAIITFILLMIYIFKPSSNIYKIKLLGFKKIKYVFIAVFCFQLIINTFIFSTNCSPEIFDNDHHHQYFELAKSFSKGNLHLDLPVTEKLLSLENPYDTYKREIEDMKLNIDFYWDTAYYEGKYYVYFGVVPVILSYLPFYLITGKEISNTMLIFIIGTFTIISLIYLLYQIIKRWFKNTSVGMFLILSVLLLNTSGLLYCIKNHDLYNVPIIFSLFFISLGLGLWISSYNKEKNCLNKIKLGIGSLCLALLAGCRPQFLLSSFFVFPLFFSYFFKEGKITKRKVEELIVLLFPYILVAIPLMLYNYFRFESVFDFGANYNLTTNDMTKRGFSFDRIFPGLYYYLIDIPNIIPIYPFIEGEIVKTNYLGNTISEKMYGGYLISNLICLFSLYSFKMKNEFKDKKIYYISILSIIFALIIILVNTQMAGILPRYFIDFSWLFLLSTILVILTLSKKFQKNPLFIKIIVILVFISFTYNMFTSLFDATYQLKSFNPSYYETLRYIFNFWL